MRSLTACLFCVLLISVDTASAQNDNASTPAGAALSTIFSPTRAPQRKTMGLLQRSFLDLADQGDAELEVAIVVDGTDSMATELAGVRSSIHQMLADLKRYRQSEVRAALVIYRDTGSPSGECVVPLSRFTANEQEIAKAVESLVPESGAPFFHELSDVGIHTALTQLPWTEDPRVQRWILMFGDAPPYAEGFQDPKHPTARRRYATELLVALAARKNVRINSVLCTSSENVVEPYDKAVDETRDFMNRLASGTDGLMLDLSYPEIRTALIDADRQPEIALAKIEPIAAIDLAAARRAEAAPANAMTTVSLAILPHAPFSNMTFDPRSEAVQVSTALRHRFSQLPGVRVVSPVDIERQLRRVRADGIDGENMLRGLAARLGVDYVVWGRVEPNTPVVHTAAYRRRDGERVVEVSFGGDRGQLTSALLTAVSKEAGAGDEAWSGLSKRIASLSLESGIDQPLAADEATSRELLAALEALERALAAPAGEEASVQLLKQADASIRAAIAAEPRNALGHWLSANVAYNQAARLFQNGEVEAAEARMREMKSSLRRAVRERDSVKLPSLVTEIEADHALLVARDASEAIEKYKQLTSLDSPPASQLRAHWMLAGIYAGDWGVAESATDPALARDHVIQILANWPESPEATLLKQWLRWDESTEQTDFNYLPQINVTLSQTTET